MKDKYYTNSDRRLVSIKPHYINAKEFGCKLETISEFPSRVEANEALPALKELYPDHIVFVSMVCTNAWKMLDDETKSAVRDIIMTGAAA